MDEHPASFSAQQAGLHLLASEQMKIELGRPKDLEVRLEDGSLGTGCCCLSAVTDTDFCMIKEVKLQNGEFERFR